MEQNDNQDFSSSDPFAVTDGSDQRADSGGDPGTTDSGGPASSGPDTGAQASAEGAPGGGTDAASGADLSGAGVQTGADPAEVQAVNTVQLAAPDPTIGMNTMASIEGVHQSRRSAIEIMMDAVDELDDAPLPEGYEAPKLEDLGLAINAIRMIETTAIMWGGEHGQQIRQKACEALVHLGIR